MKSLPLQDWTGRRVTAMGLGRHGGGVAAARWLAEHGALVTVTDLADAATLGKSLGQLGDVPIASYRLGEHRGEDFEHAEFIVVNPAVPPTNRWLAVAKQAGAALTSEIELFLERCPATVVGVTGSTGKSTTATMLHEILQAAGRRSWLGGNIGRSLLGELDQMSADDIVVLELSSFQLAHLSEHCPLPKLAILTNLTPQHLNWHGTFEAYAAAKQRLLQNTIIANEVADIPALRVPGDHNRHNAQLAAAAARRLGVSRESIHAALANFTTLPHRLQFVAEKSGRRFINDSKATSPAATLAALAATTGLIWLILGGKDEAADFDQLAVSLSEQVQGIALIGESAPRLAAALSNIKTKIDNCHDLPTALCWTFAHSQPGDTILLSPACPSLDQFPDYAARGQCFIAAIGQLAECVD